VDRVTAEIAEEVAVLFEYEYGDTRAGE